MDNLQKQKRLVIYYEALLKQGEFERMAVEITFAEDIACSVLSRQEESLFVKRASASGFVSKWLDMLAQLQGYSGARFEYAEELKC